jgi:hypothetical protein
MSVYQSSPDMAPDIDFEPGSLHHLVAGNRGRLLDPRRTPVSVAGVRLEVGFFDVRVEAFEDAGASWEVPLEEVSRFQFERGGRQATSGQVAAMEQAVARLAREQVVAARKADRARTEARITTQRKDADTWLAARSQFLAARRGLPDPATRRGDGALAADLEAYLRERDCWDVESAFAMQYVSNPGSGEMVKGHRIVLAELGLVSYAGAIVRDPSTFSGGLARARRADHIVRRLAFLRALLARLQIDQVRLWRGLSADAPLRRNEKRSFVSTTFDEAVARSHFDAGLDRPSRALVCQTVPCDRLFMTYLETAAMNARFLEAEAVLLARTGDGWP